VTVAPANATLLETIGRPARASCYLKLLRPRQWTKNLIVLAALVFSGQWWTPEALWRALAAAAAFSMIASAIYCLNDCFDAGADRLHPTKRLRPIAAGFVSTTEALFLAAILVALGISLALALDLSFCGILVLYGIINVGYTLRWKSVAIVDVMIVASGFLLRAVAGALVLHVSASAWLLACTTFLSLFLALVKRRQELLVLENGGQAHRRVLESYSLPLLDQLITSTLTVTLLSYILYTFFARKPLFMFTVAFVVYGLFRYLYLVHQHRRGGSPEEVLLTDRPILLTVLLWGGSSAVLVLLDA
jgi:4-hydroxybenzoate polyprenyltransferase